jgi:type I restriction enzyme S subunit
VSTGNDGWSEGRLIDVTQPAAPIGYGIVQPGPYARNGVPVIAIRDLVNLSDRTDTHRSSPSIEAAYRRSRVVAGDILISVKGTTGRIGITPKGFTGNISRDVARVRLTDDHEPEFWFQLLRSFAAQQTLQMAAVGSTRQELSIGTLKTLSFRFPNRTEQGRISEALSRVDHLIDTLELMCTKKQEIKQGLMQQLLTGRSRLPGFTENWSEKKISEIAAVNPESLGGGASSHQEIDYISLEDVQRGNILGATRIRFGDAPSRARRVIREHDVLFGTVRPNLQSHALYRGCWDKPIASTGFAVVRTGSASDPNFLFQLFMSHLMNARIDRIVAGSSYPAVSSSDVGRLAFMVPSLGEQQAIGEVLSEFDKEISLLKMRSAKAVAMKQGMMQELLTGRTRLAAQGEGEA